MGTIQFTPPTAIILARGQCEEKLQCVFILLIQANELFTRNLFSRKVAASHICFLIFLCILVSFTIIFSFFKRSLSPKEAGLQILPMKISKSLHRVVNGIFGEISKENGGNKKKILLSLPTSEIHKRCFHLLILGF